MYSLRSKVWYLTFALAASFAITASTQAQWSFQSECNFAAADFGNDEEGGLIDINFRDAIEQLFQACNRLRHSGFGAFAEQAATPEPRVECQILPGQDLTGRALRSSPDNGELVMHSEVKR